MTQTKHKPVSQLAIGDKLIAADGSTIVVASIATGYSRDRRDEKMVSWARGSWNDARIIEWRGGWTCLRGDDLVEVAQ